MFTKLSRETKKWVAYLLMAAIIFSDAGLVKAGDVSAENYNTEGNVIYSDVYHDYSDNESYGSDYIEGVIVEDGTVEESAVFETTFEDNNTENTNEAVSTENETVYFESEKDSSNNKAGILKYIDDLKEEKNNATPKKNLVNEIIEVIENGVKYLIYGPEESFDLPVRSGGVSGNFTVSFNANGGTPVPEAQTVSENEFATKPTPDPTKTGFTFGGWYKDSKCTDGNEWNFDTEIKSDITLFAKWMEDTPEPVKYTVTFNTQDGSTVYPQTVSANEPATKPTPDPTKTGYTFGGWYKDSKCTDGNEWNFDTEIKSDITLFAKWMEDTPEPVKYTVTFNTQDGSTVYPQTVSVNELATKPTPDPTKTGYTFGGWYKDSKCTDGNEWNFDTEIKSDITLFAKWTAIEYSISCNTAEHGTIKASVSKATAGTEVTITGTPEDGYVLKSIKVNDGADLDATNNERKFTMPSKNVVVNATFVKMYSITADPSIKNATVTIDPTKQIVGGIVKITVAPEIGYYVKTVSANGINLRSTTMPTNVEKGSQIEINDYVMPAADVVITAEVEKIDYTITKNETNATIAITGSKTKANYGDTVEFTVTPTAGNDIGSVEVINNRDKKEVTSSKTSGSYSFTMPAGDVTIKVIAGKKHSLEKTVSDNGTIKMSTDEGEITVSGNIVYGKKVTVTVEPDSGYRVLRDAEGPYIIVRSGGKDEKVRATNPANPNEFVFNMPDADAVVLAEFEPIPKWTVSFNMIPADVSTQKIEPQKDVEDGTRISEPKVTPVTGYKLYGWYKDSECTEANKWDFDTPVTSNLILYAKWVKVWTVSFDVGSFGKTEIPAIEIEDENKISVPAAPESKDVNYEFAGWYTDPECLDANKWNFDTSVTSNMTLYAKWIKSAPEPGKVSVLFGRLAYDYDELATYNIASKLTILQGTKKIDDINVDEDIEKAAVELLPGNYVLTEEDTPYSYKEAVNVNFSITSDGAVMIGDEPATYLAGKQIVELISGREYTYAVFEKLDDEGGFVEGANLDIYKAIDVDVYENENGEYKEIDIAGEPVDSIVNTEKGFYEQIGLHEDKTKHLKYGEHYVIYESKTPEGYLQACPLEFFIQADLVSKRDIVYVWDYKDGYVQEEIDFEEANLWLDREPQHPCVVMVDIKMSNPTVKIRVVDEDSNDDYDLNDATVVISDEDGEIVGDWISNGKIFEKKLTPGKKYTLTMETAPVGYSSVRDYIEFEVGEDGKVYVDDEKQKDNCLYLSARLEYDVDTLVPVSIKKITGAGQHLSGAELAIYDYYQDGAVVGGIWRPTSKSVTSVTLYDSEEHNDLGAAFFKSTGKQMEYALFPQHKYVLYELNAPSLYEVAEPVEFTMGYVTNENKNVNLPTSVQMIDKISSSVTTTVSIRKIASNTKSWLKNAVLYVYPVDGESRFNMNDSSTYTAKIVTNGTDQPITVNYYKYYVLKETSAPSGYSIAKDITFCVKEDGVYVNGQRLADNTPITMIDVYKSPSKSDKDDDDNDKKKDKSSSSSSESNITNGSPLVISGGTAGTPSTVAPGTSSLPAAGTPGGLKGVYPTTVNIGGANVTVDPATFYQTVEYLVANKNNVPQNVKNLVDAYIDKILEVNPNFFDNASAAVKGYVLGRRKGKLPQTGGFVGTPSMYLLALLVLMMGLWLVVSDKKKKA